MRVKVGTAEEVLEVTRLAVELAVVVAEEV